MDFWILRDIAQSATFGQVDHIGSCANPLFGSRGIWAGEIPDETRNIPH